MKKKKKEEEEEKRKKINVLAFEKTVACRLGAHVENLGRMACQMTRPMQVKPTTR